jgi:hypothetical protein
MSAPVVGLQNQVRLAGLGGFNGSNQENLRQPGPLVVFLHHQEKISLTFLMGKKIGKHIYN